MMPAAASPPASAPSAEARGGGGRHAVVLSGGGARGAYEIGVMKALFEGRSPVVANPRRVTIFTGTSVGAYNAAFLAQEEQGAAAIGRLEALWRDRIAGTLESCGNGVYRLRWDPVRFLDPGCLRNPLQLLAELGRDTVFWGEYAATYGNQLLFGSESPPLVRLFESFDLAALFSREPLEALLADTIDLNRLRASPHALAVVSSDWRNGLVKVYKKEDVIRLGTDTILASTAIPGIFAPVVLDDAPCVDGGLLMNTPLKPAIEAGADVLHVIYVDPLTRFIPFPDLPNTFDTAYRIYTILLAAQINGDARYVAAINHELEALAGGGAAPGGDLPAVRARRAEKLGRAAAERQGDQHEKDYRPLIVHRYRPKTEMGGAEAFLNFRRPAIEDMIQQGYEDAMSHDCSDGECVLPPVVRSVAGRRRGSS